MNHCFIICDAEISFADKMARYVNKRHLSPYIMEAYTDTVMLIDYGKKHYIDVLLIDEYSYCAAIDELNIGKIFLLMDDRAKLVGSDVSGIYKYSAIPEIMNIVMCDYADRNHYVMPDKQGEGKTKLVGAFSPVSNYRHTSMVLTMAMLLAEQNNVLYLNLKTSYGYRKILNKESEIDISDLIYEISNGRTSMEEWNKEIFCSYGKLNYILPAISMTDLQSVETKNWLALMESLTLEGGYDYIILDLDESINSCYELLDKCDYFYSFYEDDKLKDLAFMEFNDTMNKLGFNGISQKCVRVKMPDYEDIDCNEDYLTKLKDGRTGFDVRKILEGQQ